MKTSRRLGVRSVSSTDPFPPSGAAVRGDDVEHAEDLGAVADHVAVARLAPAQDPVAIDDEGRAVGDVPVLVEDVVGADDGAVQVAQQRKRQVAPAREGLVAERAVTADGEDRRAALTDLASDLAQVAELRSSDAAKIIAIEHQHDVPAAEVAERDGAATG